MSSLPDESLSIATGKKPSTRKSRRASRQFAEELATSRQNSPDRSALRSQHGQTENGRQGSERRYAQLFENANDSMYILSRDGRFLAVNPKFTELTGLSEEEILGRTLEVFCPESVTESLHRLERALQEGKLDPYELEITTPLGKKILSCSAFVYFEKRTLAGVIHIAREVTEGYKRKQEKLQKNEEYYRTILATTPDYIYLTDAEGNLLDVNVAVLNRVGLSLEQLRQRNIKEFLAGDNTEEFIQAEAKLRGGHEVRGLEVSRRTARGEIFDYEINAIPLKKDGKVTEILGIARDITKRRQAEEALRKVHKELARGIRDRTIELAKANATLKRELAERRQVEKLILRAKREWETTFDDVAELIVFTDAKGTILRCNRAVCRAFKTSYQDLIGRPVEEVFYGAVNSAAEVFRPSRAASGLTGKRMETHFPRLNGWFEVTRHPITSPTGRARQGAVYTVTDISERKVAEEKLRASHQQLRALSAHLLSVREEERKRVAREIHDELGQILTSVKIGLSRLVSQLPTTSSDPSSLWQEKITGMTKLIDTALLSVRRISTSLRPEVLDHFGIIAAMEWQAQEFQCQTGIRCKFTSTLERVDLDQDRCTALFRILQETLTNVARHAEATSVNIRLHETARALVLKVTDNGKGITENAAVDIHSLGLLGIRERTLLLGGEFCIKGVQGKGTTVIVRIPFDQLARND